MSLLNRFRRQVAQLVSPQVKHDLAVLASREFAQRLQDGFDRESDPYGVPWVPAKKKSGKTLTRTGALRSGLFVTATPKTVEVVVTGPAKRYGRFHQTGTRRMPRRRFMPDGDIPPAWAQAMATLSDQYFARRYGRP